MELQKAYENNIMEQMSLLEFILPTISFTITLLLIFYEFFQFFNICLDLSDEDDEPYASKAAINAKTGKPLRDTDFIIEEPPEDNFLESVLFGLYSLLFDLLNIEKIMFPFFFGHLRRL